MPAYFRAHPLEWPGWWEWGTWVSLLLGSFGITKERVGWLKNKLGLQEPLDCCPACEKYQAWLNSYGGKVVMAWRRLKARTWSLRSTLRKDQTP